MRFGSVFACINVACGLLALTGCGESHQLTPARGVVRLDGKPLIGVVVRFGPDVALKDRTPPGSTATTDANGQFQLVCDNGKDGAVVGPHLVTVYRPNPRDLPEERRPPPGPPIPPIYQSVIQTPLKFQVKGDQTDYPIDLKSKVK